jgi:hypothetical protein
MNTTNNTPLRVSTFQNRVWGQNAIYVCLECGKRTRETGDCESGANLCRDCFEMSGIDNEHSDGEHRDTPHPDCPRCQNASN